MKSKTISSYVCNINENQLEKLSSSLKNRNWELLPAPHAHWQAKKDNTTIVAYQSGKLVVQGKGTADFITFVLEPEVLGTSGFGYENLDLKTGEKKKFIPHAGLDESGKGDFFGPLVIAAVYVETDVDQQLEEIGVQDSKRIKSPKKINFLANEIRRVTRGKFAVVPIGPEAYNRLYQNFANLNKLLAWGHARALENLLQKAPECESALADKFGNEKLIESALMREGRTIKLEQRTKAESDVAVAAASILARDEFLRRMSFLGSDLSMELPKGAGANVKKVAGVILEKFGREQLEKLVKTHFRTFE